MITLSKSKLLKFAELSELQIDGRSEFAYTNRLEHFAELVLSDLDVCMEHVPENEEPRQQLTARVRELELVVSLKDEAIAERTDRVRELEEENARLNSEIEMLKSGKRSNIRLGMEIAASQAYAEQLREALQWAKAGFNQAAMGIIIQRELEENFNLCRDALALPRDTSALDAYVSEKMKEAVSTQKEYYESVFQDGAKRIATLTRQRDLAVEALEKQGHSAGCRKNAFGDICTCGLDDLLSTIKEIENKGV